jgi:hypothetical protein
MSVRLSRFLVFWRKSSNNNGVKYLMRDLKDRILSRIVKEPGPLETECWIWQGARTGNGYGGIKYQGQMWGAHRLSYTVFVGPIPAGEHVLHHCDNPICCSPSHLYLGGPPENTRDKVVRERCNPWGKPQLTGEEIIEARERVARGLPQAFVAEDLGITPYAIWAIVNGLTRTDVGGPLTISEPKKKTSRFFGVSLQQGSKWQSQIRIDGKKHYLGRFDDETSAALAYNAAIIAHGLRRPLNVIPTIQPYRRYR